MRKSKNASRGCAARGFRTFSLSTQLLLAINSPLVVLLTLFLVYDFHREMAERVDEKQIALNEEAKTILPAVLQMQHHSAGHVQSYINTVCAKMQDDDSPEHHIAVVMPERVLQAESHHRDSPEYLEAIQHAASSASRSYMRGHEIIAGSSRSDNATVYVSEDLHHLRQSVWNDLFRRIAVFLVLAVVAGVILNLALFRLVTSPLRNLVAAVREIASGKLGVQTAASSSSVEFRFVSNEFNEMSKALAVANHYRTLQMQKAREIQQHLIPDDRSIVGLSLSSIFKPADEVGGDFYDVISMPDGTVLLCVADVAGHGVSAAMSAMLLRALLHNGAEIHDRAITILEFMNRRFADAAMPGDFATVILVQFDLAKRRLEYVSAGHESGVLISPNGAHRVLESTGLIIGVEKDAQFESHELNFEPGDRLLLVTDGVTETQGGGGELFGLQRLIKLVRQSSQLPIDDVTGKLYQALIRTREHAAPHDDVTVVLAEMASETGKSQPMNAQ